MGRRSGHPRSWSRPGRTPRRRRRRLQGRAPRGHRRQTPRQQACRLPPRRPPAGTARRSATSVDGSRPIIDWQTAASARTTATPSSSAMHSSAVRSGRRPARPLSSRRPAVTRTTRVRPSRPAGRSGGERGEVDFGHGVLPEGILKGWRRMCPWPSWPHGQVSRPGLVPRSMPEDGGRRCGPTTAFGRYSNAVISVADRVGPAVCHHRPQPRLWFGHGAVRRWPCSHEPARCCQRAEVTIRLAGGREGSARVLGSDVDTDLALLRTDVNELAAVRGRQRPPPAGPACDRDRRAAWLRGNGDGRRRLRARPSLPSRSGGRSTMLSRPTLR